MHESQDDEEVGSMKNNLLSVVRPSAPSQTIYVYGYCGVLLYENFN